MLLPVQVTFRNVKDSAGLEEMVQEEARSLSASTAGSAVAAWS